MATPQTLFEYYQSLGKSLPSFSTRFSDPSFASAAQRAGITQAQYTGSGSQNTVILNQLLSSTQPTRQLSPEQTQFFTGQISNIRQQVQTIQPQVAAFGTSPLPIGTDLAKVIGYSGGGGYSAQFGNQTTSFASQAEAQAAVDRYNARIQQPPPTPNIPSTITGDTLAGTQAPTTVSPSGVPVAGFELGPTELSFQKELEDLRELIKASTGEAAFRAGQEIAGGIPEFSQTMRDLTNQLNALKAESAAIAPQLEEQAAGRGITTTILGRQEQALLRQNAIKSLGVASLLQATQGNIATANDLVDRAVKAKFGPIKEEIDTRLTNLNLLLKDPELTLEQQRRAQAQKSLQQARNDEADAQAKVLTSNYKLAFDAINKAQKAKTSIDALTLQRIQNAPTSEEGLRLYNQVIGGLPSEPSESVVDIRQAKESLANLLGQVAGYASRDEAIADLNKFRSSIVTRIGEDGFAKLQAEVDRIFPPPQEQKERVGETSGFLGSIENFFSRLFSF